MKLIQKGIEDVSNEIRVKCKVCDAIFDISADDIEKPDACVRRYYTTCPNSKCKATLEIMEGSIPSSMRWKIDLREVK